MLKAAVSTPNTRAKGNARSRHARRRAGRAVADFGRLRPARIPIAVFASPDASPATPAETSTPMNIPNQCVSRRLIAASARKASPVPQSAPPAPDASARPQTERAESGSDPSGNAFKEASFVTMPSAASENALKNVKTDARVAAIVAEAMMIVAVVPGVSRCDDTREIAYADKDAADPISMMPRVNSAAPR